ncbi:MAG: hypothetical protein ILP07_06090 [Treponema sp.]|nr:hypothetical protein [Treponema sp.]
MKKIIAILAILTCVFAYSHADGYKYLHTEKISEESMTFYEFYLNPDYYPESNAEEFLKNTTPMKASCMSYNAYIFSDPTVAPCGVLMAAVNRSLSEWYIVVVDDGKPVYINRVYSFDTAYSIYQSKVDELVSQVFSN